MRNFFGNLGYRIASLMEGRNGLDTLAQWAMGGAIVFVILDAFFATGILTGIGTALMFYSIYRCCSKKVADRALENAKFESWVRKPTQAVSQARTRFANRKTTKYLKCKQCGQQLSVPKGKGTLRVTCPKCKNQTTIKS